MLAFHLYAFDHQDLFPRNFDQVASFLPDAGTQTNLTPEQFEIVYRGSLSEITNLRNVIVIRQKQAWQSYDGKRYRAYGFADGHSEIRSEADGKLEHWEAQHRQKPNGQSTTGGITPNRFW